MKKLFKNYLITFVFIITAFIVFKPFVIYHLSLRAQDYAGSYMFKDAVRVYKRLLLLNPDDAEAWTWLAYSYQQTGDTPKAIEAYKKALEACPNNVVALYDLAVIYIDRGDLVAAKDYLEIGSKAPQRVGDTDVSRYRFYRRACSTMLQSLDNKK